MTKVKESLWDKIDSFELNHKVSFFIGIMILTIIFTRLIVFIHNPTPFLFNFELHHFDYGLLILVITVLFQLFGRLKKGLSLFIIGVSFGLIIDDLWFIRSNFIDPSIHEVEIYSSTLPNVFILTFLVLLIILVIKQFAKKKKSHS